MQGPKHLDKLFTWCIVWFQKISKPHHRGSLKIPRRKGVLKAKIFKGKYEPELEFPEVWGVQTKKTLRGESMEQELE